jgi:hypothetical protein
VTRSSAGSSSSSPPKESVLITRNPRCPSPFPRRCPELAAADSPSSGFPHPCRPCSHRQGEPPPLLAYSPPFPGRR